jgi:spermidine/putrescine transport system substrate-binding protein
MKTKIHFVWTGMICLMIATGFLALFVPGNACAGSTKQELVFLTWSEYMDPDIIKEFEEKFKAKVKNIYFETEDKREQLLSQTMGKGYDVILASGVNTLSYIRRNWLVPLNSDQIPNLKHIDPKWFSVNPKITAYGVPYLWGTLGIAYRKDFIKEEVTSWEQLFEPDEKLHGKILMINDARDAIGMALKYLGYSINSTNPEALAKAEALLLAQKPFVKKYGYLA